MLRLPVAHCELNPIELARASVKGYIAKHNKDYNLAEIERLTPQGFEHTTTDMWRHFCRHVVDAENDYIKKDWILEDAVEEIIIEIGLDDEESDGEEEDTLDDDDRQLINRTLQQSTDAQSTSTNSPIVDTHSRRDLNETFQNFDPQFLKDVLPYDILESSAYCDSNEPPPQPDAAPSYPQDS